MGDLTFQNNVPDPSLAGKELPTFKFELEKSKGKVLGNSFGKEATVEVRLDFENGQQHHINLMMRHERGGWRLAYLESGLGF